MNSQSNSTKSITRTGQAVLVFLAMTILLSSCLVNQRDLWANDKLSKSAPTARIISRANISYGSDPLQKLDLYLPESGARGIIIWFHSGGWCCGDKSGIDPLILSTIEHGYAIASVNYRLVSSVTAEQQLADGDRAVRFIKANRGAWGAGAGKVFLAGGSAGGTLALLLSAAPGYFAGPGLDSLAGIDPRPDAVISFVGPSDLRPYVDGSISGWGSQLVEGFLGCSNHGTRLPTTTTTTQPPPSTSSSSSSSSSSTTSTTVALAPAMPLCDPARVLKFSPVFWAVLTVFLRGSGQLPPAYLAYGDLDTLVPPASQGAVLHDWWAAGGSWLATYYDNPPAGDHNLSYAVNATAFNIWLSVFGAS